MKCCRFVLSSSSSRNHHYHGRFPIATRRTSSSGKNNSKRTTNCETVSEMPSLWTSLLLRSSSTSTATTNVIPNTGSIARDVLAAERTFLAWSRTGLGFCGAGSALLAAYHNNTKTGVFSTPPPTRSEQNSRPPISYHSYLIPLAAGLLVSNGGFLLVFATRRYWKTTWLLRQDKFLLDTRGTLWAVLVTATSTLTSMGLVGWYAASPATSVFSTSSATVHSTRNTSPTTSAITRDDVGKEPK